MALFQGRGHYYERGDPRAMATAIETLARLGGRTLFLTNAAGGLHTEWEPPALVAIVDHINFAGTNPLIGHPGDERFVPLTRAYDPGLLATLRRAAKTAEVELHEGVYMWFNGPSFETPAEIGWRKFSARISWACRPCPKSFSRGCMASHCVAVSLVTNFAAGLSGGDPSHEETQEFARRGSERFANCCAPSSRARRRGALMLPQEIIRAKRDGRALDGRGDRGVHRRPDIGRGQRRAGRGVRHGGFLSRHEHRRARASHARDDALGRSARLERGQSARPDRRQAFHRRHRRQRQPDAGADARRLRRLSCR